MKRALMVSFVGAVLMLSICRAGEAPLATPAKSGEVKWHPGHYLMVRGREPQPNWIRKEFRGVQKLYYWKQLEPAKGEYDFSRIKADLEFLANYDKRLVIQVQTKAFGKGANYTPAYLRGPEYGGGIYQTSTGSFNPVIWNDKVNERLLALYRALGREFDSHPALEVVVLPETAPSSNINRVPQPGVDPYTHEKFVQAIKDGMKALKEAFPHTIVIQYVNFPRETLKELTDYQKELGVGLGGPDVRPYDPGLGNPANGIYRFYPQLSGIVPLGAAVQSPDYTIKRHNGPFDPTPVNEIYEFGRDKLHLNYMFWFERPKYFENVLKLMNGPAFPKDAAGGLDARRPKAISSTQ